MTARTAPRRPAGAAARAGFTLLEMLAVILIIAILIAVAFPAYQAVMVNTRIATAKAEMASVGTSIAEFKAEFNVEPPSYIDFQLTGTPATLPASTKAFLRQMFPQIVFDATLQDDLTDAGVWSQQLEGSECLVFFLGGIRRFDDTNGNSMRDAGEPLTNELVGFSKNPSNPFAQPSPGQTNRLGPFFEFDTGRLGEITRDPTTKVMTNFTTDAASFTGQPLAFADKLPGQTVPLLYASTAATGRYRATDAPELTNGPYKKSATTYWNPNTFQIISPGFDGNYGVGGIYDPKSLGNLNPADQDNLANFADGRLGG